MPVLVDGELVLYGFCGADDWFDEGFTDRDVLDALSAIGRETDVTVRLNSGGGFTDAGKAIFNALKAHLGRVTVSVDGIAASAASIIAMAGDDVIMRTGALMMVHEASGITFGDADEHRRGVEWLERESAALASIYAEKTGGTVEEMRALMQAETWLTASEAVEQGFADSADSEKARAVAAFDYRAYANAPKPLKARARKENWSLDEARKAVALAAGKSRPKENPMTDKPAAGTNAATTTPAGQESAPAQPPASAAAAPPTVTDLDAARAEGRTAALAYVTEVTEICRLAGAPEKAQAFVEKGTATADVRKALLDARAHADGARTVVGTPSASTAASGDGRAGWDKAVASINARVRA